MIVPTCACSLHSSAPQSRWFRRQVALTSRKRASISHTSVNARPNKSGRSSAHPKLPAYRARPSRPVLFRRRDKSILGGMGRFRGDIVLRAQFYWRAVTRSEYCRGCRSCRGGTHCLVDARREGGRMSGDELYFKSICGE